MWDCILVGEATTSAGVVTSLGSCRDKGSQMLSSSVRGQEYDVWRGSCWELACTVSLHMWWVARGEAECGLESVGCFAGVPGNQMSVFFVSVQKAEQSFT